MVESDPVWSWDLLQRLSHRCRGGPGDEAVAGVLSAARRRWWCDRVVVRAMAGALLFTLPEEDYPYAARVIVRWSPDDLLVSRWHEHRLVEEHGTDGEHVAGVLATVLEHLTGQGRQAPVVPEDDG